MRIFKNALYDGFRCIADKCPDSCCKEWDVQVDPDTAAAYRALPGSLGDRLRSVLSEEDGDTILSIENGRCPMWRSDGLCRIQAELGHEALCKTCRDFPRLTHDYGDFVELGLELSCPEAARLLLTSPAAPPVITGVPGGEEPEYDKEAMDVLLRTRQEALTLLQDSAHPLGHTLAIFLMYGYHAQAQLDGAEDSFFDVRAALAEAQQFASPANTTALPQFYSALDILTEKWRVRLSKPITSQWSEPLRALARYGIERYWLQAVSDYDLVSRVKMVIVSCLLVKALGGDPIETAQLYSKEIENNADNVDAILDAAWTHPAFADNKLLDLLVNHP